MAMERLRELATELDGKGPVASLYVPRPAIQVGGEKWRILKKNVLDEIEKRAEGYEALREIVEGLELNDFRGQGIAILQSGDTCRTVQLARRPVALLVVEDRPFILPAAADLLDQYTAWVMTIDKEQPKLYVYADGNLEDVSERLDALSYEEIENRRLVQDDVFFHASQRGIVGGHNGPGIYHALGTGEDEEREKTNTAYYQETIKKLEKALPPQVRKLHVAGDPGTVGRFCELIHSDHLTIEQHEGSGEALSPERLVKTLESHIPELPEVGETISDRGEIRLAAERGQIETLYVSLDHSLLEERTGEVSEHLRLRDSDELGDVLRINEIVRLATANGAQLHWLPRHSGKAGIDGVCASLRWGSVESAA